MNKRKIYIFFNGVETAIRKSLKGRMSMSIDRRDWGIWKPCAFESHPQPLAYLSVMVRVKKKLLASFHDAFYPFVSTVQRNPWFFYTSPTLICFLDLSSFLVYMVNYQNALYLDTFSEHCFDISLLLKSASPLRILWYSIQVMNVLS